MLHMYNTYIGSININKPCGDAKPTVHERGAVGNGRKYV